MGRCGIRRRPATGCWRGARGTACDGAPEDVLRSSTRIGTRGRSVWQRIPGLALAGTWCPAPPDECTLPVNTGWRSCAFRCDGVLRSGLEYQQRPGRTPSIPLAGTGRVVRPGISSLDKRRVIVRWSGGGLQSVYARKAENLRGWRGGGWQYLRYWKGRRFFVCGEDG